MVGSMGASKGMGWDYLIPKFPPECERWHLYNDYYRGESTSNHERKAVKCGGSLLEILSTMVSWKQ